MRAFSKIGSPLNLLSSIALIAASNVPHAVHAQWASSFVAAHRAAQITHDMPQSPESRDPIHLKVDVDPGLEVEKTLIETYRRVARFLTNAKMPPPEVRIRHYLEINGEFFPPIIGWHALITNIEEVPGGLLATLRVSAKIENAYDSHHIFERYLISNDGITLIGATWSLRTSRLIIGP